MTSLTSLRTLAYTTMYNMLQTGANAISTDNIHSNYNDKQMLTEGYPQVIMRVFTSKERVNISGDLIEAEVTYDFEVRNTSASDTRSLMDEITDKALAGRTVMKSAGFSWRGEPTDDLTLAYQAPNKTVHIGTVNLTYRFMGSI